MPPPLGGRDFHMIVRTIRFRPVVPCGVSLLEKAPSLHLGLRRVRSSHSVPRLIDAGWCRDAHMAHNHEDRIVPGDRNQSLGV